MSVPSGNRRKHLSANLCKTNKKKAATHMRYDIVYDETIVSYMELYCFLGAYFQYTVTDDASRKHALHEVAEFCTSSFIQRIITQIDTLLVTYKTDDDTLLEWLSRISNGWQVESADEARGYLRQLQMDLREALYQQHHTTELSYVTN